MITAGVDDVDRIAGTFAVKARLTHVNSLSFELFDQLLRIVRSFDLEGVMRHLRRPLLRGVEKTEPGLAGAKPRDLNAGHSVVRAYLRAHRVLIKTRHCFKVFCVNATSP